MKRFAVNLTIALALGLSLTLALLWLLGGGPSEIRAQEPDDLPAGSGVGYPYPSQFANRTEPDAATRQRVNQTLLDLPLRFIANAGQTDPSVHFVVKGAGHTIFFTDEEVIFSASSSEFRVPGAGGWVPSDKLRPRPELTSNSKLTHNSELITHNSSTVRLRFLGANPHPTVEGLSPMSGAANFFLGDDPAGWQANVPTYGALAYRDLYLGVDLVYRGTEGHLKSEFLLAPGADPAAIQMVYSGVEGVRLREDGALVLKTALGELIEEAPLIYQEADGLRQEISGGYVLLSPGIDLTGFANLSGLGSYRVGFQVGAYDPTRPLVIDPALSFASYLPHEGRGGLTWSIAVDDDGNIYVPGSSSLCSFPIGSDPGVFVTQIINAGGVYTYGHFICLGGSGRESEEGIAVDREGSIYITGGTTSSDFPTHNAIDTVLGGEEDAFVTQIISSSGVYTLGYSTYLGGEDDDHGSAIAVSDDGDAYVTGFTESSDFPTHNALQTSYGGDLHDAFVTQIINVGGVYTYGYSTYLGGGDDDWGHAIAVDDDGVAYVTGHAASDDFPVHNAVQPTRPDGFGAFVTQIISAGGVYTYGYSTYLGGNSGDTGVGIAVDSDGAAYVTGLTGSSDFPTQNALDTSLGHWGDAFVTQIISAGGVYTYGFSTYLGGTDESVWDDCGWGIAVGDDGAVYVTGETWASDFPTHNPIQATVRGSYDAFVTQFIRVDGVYTYGYSTYLGGSGWDVGLGVAVDGDRNAYVVGHTDSDDFPTRNAVQMTLGESSGSAFVVKISERVDLALSKKVTPGIVAPGGAITYTLVYTNQGGATAIGVLITDVVPMTLTHAGFTSGGAQITPTGGISYTWGVAPLAPGAGGIITLTGVVSPSVGGAFNLTNRATITTTDGYFVEENLDNNVSVVHSHVGGYSIYLPVMWRQSPYGGRQFLYGERQSSYRQSQ